MRSLECRRPFCRPCRRTAPTRTSTTEPICGAIPQDLYKQDWWYRTTFTAPAGHTTYMLEFPGINYRAEVWLNGHLIAGNTQIVGMHSAHELDVSRWVNQGASNALAVKITPERALQDIDGVELADSWYDWINWNYLGYQGPGKNPANGNSFVPDRNAGIWKPVYLKTSGAVVLGSSTVNSELPLPRTDSARLTIYSSLRNASAAAGARRSPGDDHPAGQARPPDRAAGHARRRGTARGQLHARQVRAADRPQSGPVVALYPRPAQPLRPAAGVPAVQPADRRQPSAVRHPLRSAIPRPGPAVPRTRQGRKFLSEGQRQGLPGPRRGVHARPAVRERLRTATPRSWAT